MEDDNSDVTIDELQMLMKDLGHDYHAALDALQEMCRRDCDFRNGFYDPMGSGKCHDALEVLVKAGRLEWVGEPGLNEYRMAKDKEAQG